MNSFYKTVIAKSVKSLSSERGLNSIILIGTISKDLKSHFEQFGMENHETIILSLATNKIREHKNRSSTYDYHHIIVNDQRLVNIVKNSQIVKGDLIYVKGEIQYDKIIDETRKYKRITFISANDVGKLSTDDNMVI